MEVPEGTTPQQAEAFARQAAAKASPLAPQRKPAPKEKPTSFWQGVVEGAAVPFNNAARAVETGIEAVGLGGASRAIGNALGLNPTVAAAERQQQNALLSTGRRGSELGKFVGNVAGTLPTLALPGGALVQGAAGGALLTNERDLAGVAKDAVIGGIAGKVGEKATKAVAGVISPRVAPVVKRLQQRGIPLTPGQIIGAKGGAVGRAIKATEDKATSIPLVGDAISGARRRGVEAFNRAALNEPLAPIGAALPDSVPAGHEGVSFVKRTLGKAYDSVLPRLNAQADDKFIADMGEIAAGADSMLEARANQLGAIVKNDVRKFFNPDGTIDGAGLKQVEMRLGARARNLVSSGDPDARELGNALRDIQSAVRNMAARQNPQEAASLAKINEGWAKLTVIERAAANSLGGEMTPGALRTASRVSDGSIRKGASARGEALMQSFAEDAQSVLPSSIPDSGTAGRAFVGLGAAGGLGAMVGEPVTAALGAGAAALPYTQMGGKAAEWLLTGRQGPATRAVANAFRSLAPGVALTSAAGAATLPGQ